MGSEHRGWRRLWVPEYYCQHVTAALVRPDLELLPYPDHPLRPAPDLPDGRARRRHPRRGLLRPEGAPPGLRSRRRRRRRRPLPRSLVALGAIEHGRLLHRLAAKDAAPHRRRRALVAAGPPAPAGPAADRSASAGRRDEARRHDPQGDVPRWTPGRQGRVPSTRGTRRAGPRRAGDLRHERRRWRDPRSFPVEPWRQARATNHALLASLVADVGWAARPRPGRWCGCPVLVRRRPGLGGATRARPHRLIDAGIFPAVLWPLERTVLPVGHDARGLSRRILSIHCDGRYRTADMEQVGDAFIRAGELQRSRI